MDQIKTGKLIRYLRQKQNLTRPSWHSGKGRPTSATQCLYGVLCAVDLLQALCRLLL